MTSKSSLIVRLCAAVSGRATVLQAVIEAAAAGLLPVEFCGFVSDRKCAGLQVAAESEILNQCFDFETFSSRAAFDAAFDAAVVALNPDFVLLHYNRLVSSQLLSKFPGRVLNTHYSLLPAFPGFRAIPRALEAGGSWTGVTIHTVTERVDDGPILAQAVCPIKPADTVPSLGFRLFAAAVPLTLGLLATLPGLPAKGETKISLADGTEAALSLDVPETLREFARQFVIKRTNDQ